MIPRALVALVGFSAVFLSFAAGAQEGPMTLTRPYAIHTLTGPNPASRYVPGDVMRIGVFVTHSERPTSVVATQGSTRVDVPFYRGPIMDDLFDVAVPFDPAMVGPWAITVTRGNEVATVEAPGIPGAFTLSLLDDLHIETVGGVSTLTWRWPDLSGALALGLTPSVKILVMQEDNHDELLLNFGLRDHPIPIGAAGEQASIQIPDELEEGLLYVFRVHLQFTDGAGNIVAQSITFVQKIHPAPEVPRVGG